MQYSNEPHAPLLRVASTFAHAIGDKLVSRDLGSADFLDIVGNLEDLVAVLHLAHTIRCESQDLQGM